ncbi:MAG TPA: hypothetical protein PLS16_09415, partial [Chitinophagales bacterium]|nr:hypothetical protein [Chitinophagales bacterium]
STGATSMRSGIRATREELSKMLVSGEANTAQLYKMAKAGGELSDAMGDASQAISVMASDTFPLDSMLQGVQSITAGFQVAEGAMALFGVENEDLQKTLVKLNALMAITSGLQELQNSLQKTSALSLGFNVVMQKAYTLAVGESTGAMKLFRLALISTGIGAFVVLLGVAVSAFMKWSESSKQASKNLKLLADVNKEATQNIEDERAELTKLVAIAKNENLSKEQRKNAIKQINENYPEMLGNITLENIGTEKANELLGKQIQILVAREKVKLLSSKIAQAQIDLELAKNGELLSSYTKSRIAINRFFGATKDADRIKNEAITEKATEIENTITSLTTELNKTLANLGNNVNEKTATNVETATSKVAKETKKKVEIAKSELEIYREELSKFEKELEELQFKRVRMPISKKEEDRIKDLTAQIQKMKDVLDSMTVKQSKPVVVVAKSELEIYKDELSKLEKELEELQFKRVRMPISENEKKRIEDLTAQIQIMKDVLNSLTVQPSQPIGFIQQLENSLTKTKEELEKLFNETISSGGAIDFDDTNVVELQDKIKSLTSDLEFAKETFNQLMNGDTTTDDSSEGGGCGDDVDKKAERLKELTANMNSFAEKYQVIQSGISQATGLASELFVRHTQKETQALDDKLKRGVISQKQYDKEIAKLKNEQARKEKRAKTAEAFAMIPMAILSTFTNTTGGLIIKNIAAGIAGAFALATALMVATAPLPKYRHGGQVFKGNGFVKGRSHSEGGVNAELEGNEFVMKREAVAMYGVNNFNKLNNGLLRPDIFSPNVSNYTNQLERIDYTKEFKKMNEILEFIYQSTEDGNNIAMQVGKKLIAKENKDARRYN